MPIADREYVELGPDASPLAPDQLGELAGEIPEWSIGDGKIERERDLGGFPEAIDFVNHVAALAEEADHHPDIHVHYRRVRLVLSTHSIGGLSVNDFILAARIDKHLDQQAPGPAEPLGGAGAHEDQAVRAPNMDTIIIKDLLARAIIGINEDERRNKQDVLMNILIHVDTSLPGRTDDFQDTVDYRAIKKKVFAMVEESGFLLLERLAEEVAAICLEPEGVMGVEVTCEKPSALRFARSVGILVRRTKDA